MPDLAADIGLSGSLRAVVSRGGQPHRLKTLFRLPGLGRVMWTRDPGAATLMANQMFATRLYADHYDGDGRLIGQHDLGSGVVTNVGVTALANDFAWGAPSGAAINTLKLQNWVATGIGTNAEAATDIALQSLAAPTTANAVSGTQSLVSVANQQQFKQVTTVNYTSSLAITEWGLHSAQVLSASTGTPFTAGTATTGTVTTSPYTASDSTHQGEQQLIFQDTTAASPFYGLCISNTSNIVTVPAWYLVSNGTLSGVNPVNADAFLIKPVLWDRRKFLQINVNNLDSITFTYLLTINSGG